MTEPVPQPAEPNAISSQIESESSKPVLGGSDSAKAAQALSSLSSPRGVSTDVSTGASTSNNNNNNAQTGQNTTITSADRQALGEAMSRLEITAGSTVGRTGGGGGGGGGGDGGSDGSGGNKGQGLAEEKKKEKIKIDAGDVALLVSELEVSKVKATELLRAVGGDAVQALVGYVRAVG